MPTLTGIALTGHSSLDNTLGGVYYFWWTFSIGTWCEYTNRSTTYSISQKISGGAFNVTMDPSAPYPTPTPPTCASFLGAVSYAGATTYDVQRSVDNPPRCVQTQSITADPAPCRGTLDAYQLDAVAGVMGWNQSNPNATTTSTSTSGPASGQTAESIAIIPQVRWLCILTCAFFAIVFGQYL
ncbi:hypothetical protein SCUP515_04757 [Seiridium cupressi]